MSPIDADLRRQLERLRRDGNGGWDADLLGKAPHKPLMLLAIADLYETGRLRDNLIPYDEALLRAFDLYWTVCCGGRPTNPLQPYWYLKGDGFWRHQAQPAQKRVLDALYVGGSRVPARRVADEVIAGAVLDPRLHLLLQRPEGRAAVREVLIQAHFRGALQAALARQHAVIIAADRCAAQLRQAVARELADLFAGDGALDAGFTDESRSLAFRTVVVEEYQHTCAMCGARLRTPSGRSAVQAAHIVPFAACHNNDPRNGLALCPLHHWAFDQGMVTVTTAYVVRVHPYAQDLPADEAFRALQGRDLRQPSDERMRPAPAALAWHGRMVFGKAG